MKRLEGYAFVECLEMAPIDNANVLFLHINQLIENKKIVNRPKDQIDIAALERIRKLRDNS